MAVTFPAPPHRWESRGLLSLYAAFSFWFILLCWKAAWIRGKGTVLPAAALQIQRAWLCAGTAVGEVLCASNSRYSSARIFYQQRSRGDRAAARLFLPFPVPGKGRALRVWHLSAVYCWICDCRAVCSPQGPSHLAVPSGYGQGVLKEKWVDIGE